MAWCCQATSHYLNQCWSNACIKYSQPDKTQQMYVHVLVKQPWRIWVNEGYDPVKNNHIMNTKQSTTKVYAYLQGILYLKQTFALHIWNHLLCPCKAMCFILPAIWIILHIEANIHKKLPANPIGIRSSKDSSTIPSNIHIITGGLFQFLTWCVEIRSRAISKLQGLVFYKYESWLKR